MVGKTLSEKIFTRASGRDCSAGDLVMASLDCAMIHDITGPLAVKGFIEIMEGAGLPPEIWDPSKIVMLFDHQVPADSVNAAENQIMLRDFARIQGILNYDIREGVCHQVLPEKGHVLPGHLIVGADSHTCAYGALGAFSCGIGSTDMAAVLASGELWFKVPQTLRIEVSGRMKKMVSAKDVILRLVGNICADGATYMACEFSGTTVREMEVPGRMTMCNMAIEMGGKSGIIEPDEKTSEYLEEIGSEAVFDAELKTDSNAVFKRLEEMDVSELSPQVARPHRVDDVVDVEEVEGIRVDQVFVGSCTNGRFTDVQAAAEILRGEKVADGVRMLVIPASRTEYLKCLRAGHIETLVESGALVEAPCCGPCMGGSFGLVGPGEVSLSTSNRNFKGRQGSPEASVYLCSPQTAAASAIYGVITDPREV